jgi:hypothetical protein
MSSSIKLTGLLFILLLLPADTTLLKVKHTNELDNKVIDHFELNEVSNAMKNIPILRGINNNTIIHEINSNSTCNAETCGEPNYCISSKVCRCVDDYITYSPVQNQEIFCNYKRKRQLTALLLEIIFPIGFGHFYSGRMLCGLIKLILYMLVGSYGLGVFYHGVPSLTTLSKTSLEKVVHTTLACSLICGISVWHIFDIYMLFENRYYDGNGISLVTFK